MGKNLTVHVYGGLLFSIHLCIEIQMLTFFVYLHLWLMCRARKEKSESPPPTHWKPGMKPLQQHSREDKR